MDKDIIKKIIRDNGLEVILDERYRNCGYRIKTADGTAVFCYDKGTYYCQGKKAEIITRLLKNANMGEVLFNNKVFIVYGHDYEAKENLVELLNGWGLEGLLLDQLPSEGRTIIEQLEHYIPQVNYGIVLATPDDLGREKNQAFERKRARQNVVLEMGMLFSKLGRNRVCILYQDVEGFERPSDIEGILYIPFHKNINEASIRIKRELRSQGYPV